jgi:hypothetical protein
VRVQIELQDVVCRNPEDVAQDGDEFYIVGAIFDGQETKAILTRPLQMRKGAVQRFRDDERLLYDKELFIGQTIHCALNRV